MCVCLCERKGSVWVCECLCGCSVCRKRIERKCVYVCERLHLEGAKDV